MPYQTLWRNAGLISAMLMGVAAAPAQAPVQLRDAPPPPKDIVVTARPDATRREVDRQATAITRVNDMYRDSLARFADPVCPGIMGLPAGVAGMVVDRIRYDAERVGARTDSRANCHPNIIVAFVRDGAAGLRTLLKTKGFMFITLEAAETKELAEETGPARAWNLTMLRTRHGNGESSTFEEGLTPEEGHISLGPMRITISPSSDSRIFFASRLDIVHSVVLIDLAAIDGMSIDQIADYAAMRGLARTRPAPGDAAATTILSLFDPAGERPREMTRFDLAYLHSLYEAESNLPAWAKIAAVSRAMRKEEALALKVSAQK
jgi:hypothetical protein